MAHFPFFNWKAARGLDLPPGEFPQEIRPNHSDLGAKEQAGIWFSNLVSGVAGSNRSRSRSSVDKE